ncbi:cas scaffolding protein family member 4-like [Sinocyclocheilus rhinocerous]|uniref:cas scaffolding protein family member 4-like n=1 Tax=Sinocyclocheilus rhinocerous TaxID=307959 RepID=UPI0007B80E90|nr:PREDICTED: cas scaffolding protein family member 4-like [Sinocyclocheilus rhinocerous]
METLFARALYDNTAEIEDELAFRKGEIIMVLEKNVPGSIGWWKCSLRGRQGLAPANRLAPLSPAEAENICMNLGTEKDYLNNRSCQNIYQTPKATRSPVIPIYEEMSTIYKVPLQAVPSPDKHMAQEDLDGTSSPRDALTARGDTEIYDVPSLVRKPSLFTPSTLKPLERKTSLMSSTDFHNRHELLRARCAPSTKKKVATIHPLISQDPNYDIPVPFINDDIQKPLCRYSTMPKPCKSEWIYDVPVSPKKQGSETCYYGTMPPKTMYSNKPLYDTLPNHSWPEMKHGPIQPLYDIPKPSKAVEKSCTDTGNSTNTCIYDVPPCLKQTEGPVVLPRQQCPPETDSKMSHESIEYRDKPGPMYDQLHRWPSRGRTTSRQPVKGTIRRDNKDHQRSSTVSTSSTASSSSRSSCDSFMLSSPEPEPLREVTLSQEEVSNRLLELQEAVCQSVPKLMLFVSIQWRTKEHLSQHLHQIHMATEDVTDSVTCFLNFALDVRGNAQRLTDLNLQTRLLKQLSIIEDSGLILQEAARTLRDLGWLLDMLAQDADQSQTPDHLERFVMVARTVPEDVKRLVSILNANGKLLFRVPAKEPDVVENISTSERSKSEPMVDSGIDESDYVQLQTKTEFDEQLKPAKSSLKSKRNGDTLKKQVSKSLSVNPCTPVQTSMKPSISDHCRLYFGAIQKAISVFISSLNDGQPPEKFISHSKLVIMVGQRLVNTLCSEAKNREASQEMLSVSNQLCAHLKQLAMMTKKAALDFPDKLALQEVQGIAKELAQRAQHFRMSLDV